MAAGARFKSPPPPVSDIILVAVSASLLSILIVTLDLQCSVSSARSGLQARCAPIRHMQAAACVCVPHQSGTCSSFEKGFVTNSISGFSCFVTPWVDDRNLSAPAERRAGTETRGAGMGTAAQYADAPTHACSGDSIVLLSGNQRLLVGYNLIKLPGSHLKMTD